MMFQMNAQEMNEKLREDVSRCHVDKKGGNPSNARLTYSLRVLFCLAVI